MAAGATLSTTTLPASGDRFLVPEAYAFDPLRRHDSFRAQFSIHLRYVNPTAQTRLALDELRHSLGVVGLVLEVGF